MDDVVTKNRIDDLLIELSLLDNSIDKELNVALLSDSDDMKKLNYFIFNDVDGINYHTIDEPYDSDLTILSQMDIVLYNKDDKKLEDMILENIINKHLNCKFIHIVDSSNYRKLDFLEEYLQGVSKVIKLDSDLEEYIFEIQKELMNGFYSKRIQKIKPIDTIYEKSIFEKRVDELIENRVCFTSLRYTYESDMDISKYNLKKIVREKDTIYIDKKNSEIYFLLLDIMPKKANDIIKSRIKNFSIRVSEISHKSVFDIVFGG
jgi:hypothetical protein